MQVFRAFAVAIDPHAGMCARARQDSWMKRIARRELVLAPVAQRNHDLIAPPPHRILCALIVGWL
jgi:hypothetical protein